MTEEICPLRLARASASCADVTVTCRVVRQLEDELVADLGVEVGRHEGAVGRRVVAASWPLPAPATGGSCSLAARREVLLRVQVALVVGARRRSR